MCNQHTISRHLQLRASPKRCLPTIPGNLEVTLWICEDVRPHMSGVTGLMALTHVPQTHPRCCRRQNTRPFAGWTVLHCVRGPRSLPPPSAHTCPLLLQLIRQRMHSRLGTRPELGPRAASVQFSPTDRPRWAVPWLQAEGLCTCWVQEGGRRCRRSSCALAFTGRHFLWVPQLLSEHLSRHWGRTFRNLV